MATRRELLAISGAAGAAATAGCLGGFGDGETPQDDADADGTPDADGGENGNPDAVRLEDLSVQNNHDREHRIQLAVDADGDVLHLGTYDLEGGGGATRVQGDWQNDADSYRVHARLDDGDIVTEDVTDRVGRDTNCVRALVRVDTDGELAVWVGSNCRN